MKCGPARTAQVAGQQTFLQAQRLASLFRTRVPRKALTFGRSLETSSAELATYAYRLTIRWKTRRLHRTGPDSLVALEQEWNAKAEEMHGRDRPHQQSASPSAKAAPKVLFPFDTRSRKIKSNSATTTTTPKNPKGEESRVRRDVQQRHFSTLHCITISFLFSQFRRAPRFDLPRIAKPTLNTCSSCSRRVPTLISSIFPFLFITTITTLDDSILATLLTVTTAGSDEDDDNDERCPIERSIARH